MVNMLKNESGTYSKHTDRRWTHNKGSSSCSLILNTKAHHEVVVQSFPDKMSSRSYITNKLYGEETLSGKK